MPLAKAAWTLEGTRIRASLTSTAQKFLVGGFGLTCSLVGGVTNRSGIEKRRSPNRT